MEPRQQMVAAQPAARGSGVRLPDRNRTGSGVGPTILIADGTVSGRRSITAVLRDLGHRFLEARDSAEVLDCLGHHQVDLVIADLLIPDSGGADLCRRIRDCAYTSLLPTVLIARKPDLDQEVEAIEAGADSVLPGNVHPKALRASVQSYLRRKAAIEALDQTETVIFTLAQSVEERDPALGQHCGRLAQIGAALGTALGLSTGDILALQRGGFLHDVGKVAIPDNVLFKPGPLTPDEWTIMRSHPERGERICRNVRSLATVLPIIRSHHERWDGGGYPDGLKGENIPLLARITQFADIYDALTTIRPYKSAFTPDEALRIMQQETQKGWRDPVLMDVFERLFPLFKNPNMIELSELSLQSLAASLSAYRGEDAHAIRLVSGL